MSPPSFCPWCGSGGIVGFGDDESFLFTCVDRMCLGSGRVIYPRADGMGWHDTDPSRPSAVTLAALDAAVAREPIVVDDGAVCPCSLVEPCSDQCSCANPLGSGGCARCCTYGSYDQRTASARRLVGAEEELKRKDAALAFALQILASNRPVNASPYVLEGWDKLRAEVQRIATGEKS